ncbi:MAG: MBL fold metallo-hydrolase [bacterium]|nr:MBL fold metallo-hydrolase [bacterium]
MAGFIFLKKDKEKIELFVVKYGDSVYSSKHVYYEDQLSKDVTFSWFFYVLKYKEKIILIDTGIGDKSRADYFKINYKDPVVILKEINIKPEMVSDVIITHSHFDHIGNLDKFTNAKIYIQKDELKELKGDSNNKKIADFLNDNRNIIEFDKNYLLYNFLEIEKIGGHTIGSSVVSFKYNNKNYVLTGDECYLIDNCLGKPIGTYYNIAQNKNFIEKIINIKNKIILTFHDPLIFSRYQKINDFVAQVAP